MTVPSNRSRRIGSTVTRRRLAHVHVEHRHVTLANHMRSAAADNVARLAQSDRASDFYDCTSRARR